MGLNFKCENPPDGFRNAIQLHTPNEIDHSPSMPYMISVMILMNVVGISLQLSLAFYSTQVKNSDSSYFELS